MTTEQTQREFETQMQGAGGCSPHLFEFGGNEYAYREVQRHWLTWQACTSVHQQRIDKLREALAFFVNNPGVVQHGSLEAHRAMEAARAALKETQPQQPQSDHFVSSAE